jgi:dihydropteroate synthase
MWFDRVEQMERGGAGQIVALDVLGTDALNALTRPAPKIAGLDLSTPRLMGILNVTPDSFSDGGKFADLDVAVDHAMSMVAAGADILDIGGESTRPGADYVEVEQEIARTAPVIAAIRARSTVPISIDTRKAAVADAAIIAGANIVNDVSAFTYDPALARVVAKARVPVCLMHAQGDPKTMQADPIYSNVVLDVFDFLRERIEFATAAGIDPSQMITDPGIGFGKTQEHNLALLRRLSVFHALRCPVLLGASRKRFIGTIGQVPDAADRAAGSIAVALGGAAQGVQITRVHDIAETKQAIRLQQAI